MWRGPIKKERRDEREGMVVGGGREGRDTEGMDGFRGRGERDIRELFSYLCFEFRHSL